MEDFIIKTSADGSVITLRDIQLKALEILKTFDALCKKHGIEYQLAYGTALGAVRHGGFIPWDDDVDVAMDYENYDKLVAVLDKETPDGYYAHYFDKDDRYNVLVPAMKFRMKGTMVKEKNSLLLNKCEGDGLFIDIFVYGNASASLLNHTFHRLVATLMMPGIVLIDNLGINPVALKRGLYKYARWYSKHNKDSGYESLNLTWTFETLKDRRFKKGVLFPSVDIEFEGTMLPVAGKPHEMLEVLYGPNYMEFPPKAFQKPKHIEDIELE